MKILITGSSGMLGTDLCDVLEKDHKIIGVDINESHASCATPLVFYKVGITDADEIRRIVGEEHPDIVIHAAAWTDVDGCEGDPGKADAVNVKGTESVAKAAAGRDIPLILISTDFVFDGRKNEPYTEGDPPCPISVYARTKYEAEEAVKTLLPAYAIVRTSWLFGKQGRNFVDALISKAAAGEKLRVVGDQVGSPTYTKDFSTALAKLLEAGVTSGREIFHVSNSGRCSWYEFAEQIIGYKGSEGIAIEAITSDELDRPAKRPRFSVLDNGKFNRKTGYVMRPWQEALKEYLKSGRDV